jgi:hypothetical protein
VVASSVRVTITPLAADGSSSTGAASCSISQLQHGGSQETAGSTAGVSCKSYGTVSMLACCHSCLNNRQGLCHWLKANLAACYELKLCANKLWQPAS